MNNTMLLKLLFALLLFCFHVSPQAAKADLTSEPLMEQASFAAILDRAPKKLLHDIHIELWRKQIPLSDAEIHTLEVILKEAFDPATLKTKFLSLSHARISNADSQAILDFYATPHGKKISGDEITANSGDLTNSVYLPRSDARDDGDGHTRRINLVGLNQRPQWPVGGDTGDCFSSPAG